MPVLTRVKGVALRLSDMLVSDTMVNDMPVSDTMVNDMLVSDTMVNDMLVSVKLCGFLVVDKQRIEAVSLSLSEQ